jgi:hypothetical protein
MLFRMILLLLLLMTRERIFCCFEIRIYLYNIIFFDADKFLRGVVVPQPSYATYAESQIIARHGSRVTQRSRNRVRRSQKDFGGRRVPPPPRLHSLSLYM